MNVQVIMAIIMHVKVIMTIIMHVKVIMTIIMPSCSGSPHAFLILNLISIIIKSIHY